MANTHYRYGELKAIEDLVKKGYTVQDTSNNPSYYGKDIDILASRNGKTIAVEVKWDNRIHSTGNMFVEFLTDRELLKDGWFKFCCADLIYYGDSHNSLFYVLSLDDLKQYVELNDPQQRKAADTNSNGVIKKVSEGYLVPIEDFKKQYPVEVVQIND